MTEDDIKRANEELLHPDDHQATVFHPEGSAQPDLHVNSPSPETTKNSATLPEAAPSVVAQEPIATPVVEVSVAAPAVESAVTVHPLAVDTGTPIASAVTPKNKKLPLFVVAAVLVVGMLAVIGYFVYGAVTSNVQQDSIAQDEATGEESTIQNSEQLVAGPVLIADENLSIESYNSPIGLLPPFAEGKAISGSFRLNAAPYVNATIENEFWITQDGEIALEIARDYEKTKGYIERLYLKNAEEGAIDEFTSEEISTALAPSEYINLSFASLLGLDYLYDSDNVFGGFFIYSQQAFDDTITDYTGSLIRRTDSCRVAFDAAKSGVEGLNTVSLNPVIVGSDTDYTVTFSQQTVDETIASLIAYFDACFDFSQPSIVEYGSVVDRIKSRDYTLPAMKVMQTDEGWQLTIQTQTEGDEGIVFTLLSSRQVDGYLAEDTGQLLTYRNRFAATYDACGLPPTRVTDGFGSSGYLFINESRSYTQPNNTDIRYYCAPSQLPARYANPDTSIDIDTAQVSIQIRNQDDLRRFQLTYEVRAIAEEYYKSNAQYPSFDQIKQTMKQRNILQDIADGIIDEQLFSYTLLPEGCSSDCQDFVTGHIFQDSTSTQSVNWTSYSFKH